MNLLSRASSILDDPNLTINFSEISSSSLNTKLKRKNCQKNALIGRPQLVAFFKELEKVLIERVINHYDDLSQKMPNKASTTSPKINALLNQLQQSNKVVVPMDKRNST